MYIGALNKLKLNAVTFSAESFALKILNGILKMFDVINYLVGDPENGQIPSRWDQIHGPTLKLHLQGPDTLQRAPGPVHCQWIRIDHLQCKGTTLGTQPGTEDKPATGTQQVAVVPDPYLQWEEGTWTCHVPHWLEVKYPVIWAPLVLSPPPVPPPPTTCSPVSTWTWLIWTSVTLKRRTAEFRPGEIMRFSTLTLGARLRLGPPPELLPHPGPLIAPGPHQLLGAATSLVTHPGAAVSVRTLRAPVTSDPH